MTTNPTEFLSRTGFRPVTASINAPIALTGDVTGSGTAVVATTIKADVNLTGNPTTTTQAPLDSSTRIATTDYVDAAVAAGGGSSTDYLSGKYYIQPLETVTIPLYSQMVVMGGSLVSDGVLIVNGQLYIEA